MYIQLLAKCIYNVYTITMSKKYLLYIHHPNFAGERKKSDLVNRLLNEHYQGSPEPENSALQFRETPEIKNQEMTNVYTTATSSPTARTPATLLQEIEDAKREFASFAEVNQDPEDHAKKQAAIQGLWNEYHILKEQDA